MVDLLLSRLAKFVTRRPKTVVVIWVMVLVLSLPLAGQIGGALEYDDSHMGSNNLESVRGMNYASQNFPGIDKQGTTTIVLSGSDILSDNTRAEIMDMESRLMADLRKEGYDLQIDSFYSFLANYTTAYLLQIHAAYESTNSNLSGQGDPIVVSSMAQDIVAIHANISSWVVKLAEPADFGRAQAATIANALVVNSSASSFPIPIPLELLGTMINVPANNTMVISLTYLNGDSLTGVNNIPLVRQVVHASVPDTSSLKVYVTGADAYYHDNTAGLESDMAIIEPITIILIIVLIGMFFRSFVASSIPPMVIGLALLIGFSMLYLVGTFVLSVHYTALTLMLTTMMGAGCDYCIFILSRYREERRNGGEKARAIETAIGFAGESILTSGLTVMIGFGALALASLNMMRSWSLLALGIGIALLAALTLLPALLALMGDRMFWPSKLDMVKKRNASKPDYFARTARFAIKNAKVIVLATVVISIPAAFLVVNLDSSYDLIAAMPHNESKQGMQSLGDAFGEGEIIPTYVMLNMSEKVVTGNIFNDHDLDSIENVTTAIASMGNVKQVVSPSRPNGGSEPIDYRNLSSYPVDVASQNIAKMRSMVGEDGRAVRITVVFIDGPYAPQSIETLKQIRSALSSLGSDPAITGSFVTGSTAIVYDIVSSTQADFQVIVVVAIVLIYIVLMVVLGSVVNPLRSIVTILISICWTLAALVLVFQMALNIPILWSIPIIVLVICLGLGMDYDILLTTRIREEASRGQSDNEAIAHSIEQTGGIITICGIIMSSAFATMMLSSNSMLMEMGFAMSLAILLDATVVRMYMVPAIMSLLGKWNWYAPNRLKRVKRNDEKSVIPIMITDQPLVVGSVEQISEGGIKK